MTTELLEPFVRMLDEIASPAAVRAVEAGGDWQAMWAAIAASGFLDALVGEDQGGSGLTLAQVEPLLQALGASAVPLPVGETMIARALLAQADIAAPAGPVVLAATRGQPVPCALVANHALVDTGAALALTPLSEMEVTATGVHGSLAAVLSGPAQSLALPRPANGLRPIAAVLRACLIAGAAARVCDMAAAHAAQRVQFGKPIGKQQALQQMLSVMAEDMVACRIAAQLGCAGGLDPALTHVATAKITTSAAAPRLAASAHAVHGAIGIAEEFDLQLLTRRLHEWRLADGSEGYWSRQLGAERLGAPMSSMDFARTP
ncbi:MAG TPA: acyl-CoA dehydrogenase family protein [Novosphingobium sp.]|nr:acyl-CoA dehydrogenase family protein [Novosphingobium sp.]